MGEGKKQKRNAGDPTIRVIAGGARHRADIPSFEEMMAPMIDGHRESQLQKAAYEQGVLTTVAGINAALVAGAVPASISVAYGTDSHFEFDLNLRDGSRDEVPLASQKA